MSRLEYGIWNVEYKNIKDGSWHKLIGDKNYWYADPMLFNYRGNKYLFTEAFDLNRQIGEIAVSVYENGVFGIPKIIISNPYHMSYPCVFMYHGKIYMIPETSMNGTLELYCPKSDIQDKWELKTTLLTGIKLADTTACIVNDEIYLLAYVEDNKKHMYETKVFLLDIEKNMIKEIESKKIDENIERPAGNVICDKGRYYRPLQYNAKVYGESIRMMEFFPQNKVWEGNIKDEIHCYDFPEFVDKYERTHTFGCDGEITVLDFLSIERSFKNPYYIFRRRFRNMIYKIKRGESII